MSFNQSFHTANLKNKFTAINPMLALLMFIGIAFTTIVLLPFLLFFTLLSFITFYFLRNKEFGRKAWSSKAFASKMNRAYKQPQTQQDDFYQGNADVQREQTAPYADMFSRSKPDQSRRTGRTFEHQDD